jgi:hypothetical protein
LDDQVVFRVETAEPESGLIPEGKADRIVEVPAATVEKAAAQAKDMASIIVGKLKTVDVAPSEITVEIGVSFEGGANWFFAHGKAGATVKITGTWDLTDG